MKDRKSIKAYKEALEYIPGGVDSPVRAFQSVGRTPLFIHKGSGAYITDIDGNSFIDYCLSWGVHILGHNHPGVRSALEFALRSGTSFGAATTLETELAKRITLAIPSVEKIRFVNSGTEAVMSAIRLARAFTKRDRIIKFDGCYHGHADHLLVAAGSGVGELQKSSSLGIPQEFLRQTISMPFNDWGIVKKVFAANKGQIAAIIVEPVPANMGVVFPKEGFLEYLRDITRQNGALLIFDEVITGFRWHPGGAQGHFGIVPDLTCLGKIIGGGLPVGAFGGKKEILDLLAPGGPVYQAGTLSGNPLAMSAGIAALDETSKKGFYEKLNSCAGDFFRNLKDACKNKKVLINSIGTMFSISFPGNPVNNYADLKKCDKKRFARFYRAMLEAGVYLSPSMSETNFISIRHTSTILKQTLSVTVNAINRPSP